MVWQAGITAGVWWRDTVGRLTEGVGLYNE